MLRYKILKINNPPNPPRLKTCKLNFTMTLKNVSDKNVFSVMQCQETLIIRGINFLQRCVYMIITGSKTIPESYAKRTYIARV